MYNKEREVVKMTITKYNVYVNKKKLGYVKTIEDVAKVLKKYPNAIIRTVLDMEKGEKLTYVLPAYLD